MVTRMSEAKRIEHLREEESRRDEAALRFLISDERGRWFLSRMIERCHVHDQAPVEINQVLMFEGSRRVGLELYENLRMLAALDTTGQSLEKLHEAEREYGAFLARYKTGNVEGELK